LKIYHMWLLALLVAFVLLVFLRVGQLKLPPGDTKVLHPHYPFIGTANLS